MKIGLVSDSHGNTMAIDTMLKMPGAYDVECWLHAGDFVADADYLEMVSGKKVYKVAGNGDWPHSKAPDDLIVELAGHRILLTHGHEHGVRYDTEILEENAEKLGADIVVYGHTHVAYRSISGRYGLTILNPGSVARPRDDSYGSFMFMYLEPDRAPEVDLFRLEYAEASRFY